MSLHPILQDTLVRYPQLQSCSSSIQAAITALAECFQSGHKLLLCGNGGSASDADHISGELLKGFYSKRPLNAEWQAKLGATIAGNLQHGLPAIPLPNFHGLNTAYANDCNPQYCFAQTTFALGNPGDCLLCLTTSGNSENVLLAAQVARAKGLTTIALTGQSGGKVKDLVDISICAPATTVVHIQELHLPIYHTLCLAVEALLF